MISSGSPWPRFSPRPTSAGDVARLQVDRHETVELDVAPQAVLTACRRVLFDLGWEVLDANHSRLVAMEVPLRLGCVERPAEMEIRVSATSPTSTTATLAASVHGIGRRTTRNLEAKLELVRRRLMARLH
jgi:hypothetical protein